MISKEESMQPNTINKKKSLRKKIFALFLYTCIFTNYDTGVIPASISHVKDEMDISNS